MQKTGMIKYNLFILIKDLDCKTHDVCLYLINSYYNHIIKNFLLNLMLYNFFYIRTDVITLPQWSSLTECSNEKLIKGVNNS